MKLIINADDFGIDVDRDLGILLCGCMRWISSISILVSKKKRWKFKYLIRFLKFLDISIGIHINLTDTFFLFNKKSFSTNFYSKEKYNFWLDAINDRIDIRLVKKEIYDQFKYFISVYGFIPQHIDAHNHINIFHPEIQNILEDIASIFGIPLRIPNESIEYKEKDFISFKEFCNKDYILYSILCKKIVTNQEIPFLGTTYGYIRNYQYLIEQIQSLQNISKIQIVTHPGGYIKMMHHNSNFSTQERWKEIIELAKFKNYCRRNNITYISYKYI